jgi:hypothetical protein
MKTSIKLVIAMFVFLLVYTSISILVFAKTGAEYSTLTACVFAFCGVEGGALAWIKTMKIKRGD